MIKYLNRKKYDTSTAKELAYRSEGNGFSKLRETLYRKNTGEFFLFGEGGAMTIYSQKQSDGSIGWGESIIPLTFEQAQEWAETYLDGEEYERVFDMSNDNDDSGKTVTSISLSNEVFNFARNEATKNKQPFTSYIESLIRKEMNK